MPMPLLVLFCFISQGHKTISQTLNQGKWEIELKEGAAVDFTCNGEHVDKPYYFFWYQQQPGQPPIYIRQISYLGDEHTNDAFSDVHRFTLMHSDDRNKPTAASTTLTNNRATPSDSAAYFCAINHKNEKYLKFGDGNRLRLSPKRDAVATAYLQNSDADGPTACMVRDSGSAVASVMLSRLTIAAEPTLVTGESTYGLVGIASFKANHCQVKQGEMDVCASEVDNQCLMRTDEKMNFLQLTLLSLRLLCVKMVVLSGLLTIHALTCSG